MELAKITAAKKCHIDAYLQEIFLSLTFSFFILIGQKPLKI
jgi:hypothetical protein